MFVTRLHLNMENVGFELIFRYGSSMWFLSCSLSLKIGWGGGFGWDLSSWKRLKCSQFTRCKLCIGSSEVFSWVFFLSAAIKGNIKSFNVFRGKGRLGRAKEKITSFALIVFFVNKPIVSVYNLKLVWVD